MALSEEQTANAWRTALDPAGDWIRQVLAAADVRLAQVRSGGMPDAAGLVIASDHASARAYAGLLHAKTGRAPVGVLPDDPQASRKIEEFRDSDERWMVAVRMVSEGVDIPRLAVGVYATIVSTPLFFAQAVGRFVRARGRTETASVFRPSVPSLLLPAAEMDAERDHALEKTGGGFLEADPLLAAQRQQDEPGEELISFEALEASAHFDGVLYDGAEFGTGAAAGSAEEEEFLGCPGCSTPTRSPCCWASGRRSSSPRTDGPAAVPRRSLRSTRWSSGERRTWCSPRCARSSTGWCPPTTTAPANRTDDPRRDAQGVRRPAQRAGERGAAARADRDDHQVGAALTGASAG
jgi:hypothetical protein